MRIEDLADAEEKDRTKAWNQSTQASSDIRGNIISMNAGELLRRSMDQSGRTWCGTGEMEDASEDEWPEGQRRQCRGADDHRSWESDGSGGEASSLCSRLFRSNISLLKHNNNDVRNFRKARGRRMDGGTEGLRDGGTEGRRGGGKKERRDGGRGRRTEERREGRTDEG